VRRAPAHQRNVFETVGLEDQRQQTDDDQQPNEKNDAGGAHQKLEHQGYSFSRECVT
jgi:hypothetical protein